MDFKKSLERLDQDCGHFFVIRHAQSANNALPEHLRVCDPGLTTLGARQATLLGKFLAATPLQHLYCSGFLRSLETAAQIAKHFTLSPFVHGELFEAKGCYSGYRTDQLKPEPGLGKSAILEMFNGWTVDEAITDLGWNHGKPIEDHRALGERARKVACWMSDRMQHTGMMASGLQNVHAMVIHADFKQVLLSALFPTEPMETAVWEHEIPFNTSITHLAWRDGAWLLLAYNQVEHLTDELVTV